MFFTVLLIIAGLAAWISIDLHLGKKAHRARLRSFQEPGARKGDARFFSQGDELFDHMFQQIATAQSHIHMQFYIFRDDNIGRKMLNNLKEKAREGVAVRLLIDWAGAKIPRREQLEMKYAGIRFYQSNSPRLPFLFYSLNVRNHRKITVIDGKIGYIGGFNVGDEYLGRDKQTGSWRDYHLAITGEAVADLQKQFLVDWQRASREQLPHDGTFFPQLPQGKLTMKMIPTDGDYVKQTFLSLLAHAKASVFIGTPYFIPGKEMKKVLIELVKKGVDVQILIPKYPDHPLVKDAAYPYIRELLGAGVTVHQFYNGFYHSKVIIIDSDIIDIGTANFDKRSFHINYEVNCLIYDNEWIAPVREEIEKDFYQSSEKITLAAANKRSIFAYVKEAFAKVVSPYM
ncbi:cardiolipin synthase [Evansella caseinilytica]|uniref:Cardiolipin synthase n=1 Tax=Evansella caseinilytica TaxID=1503961 RepID=A0A1H3T2X8_9BACI|nr:cardiolipin synthase [Evansella caseinilytica]SDZ44723.1 cardiolipin synthase [Evansella caseinilytica]